MMFILMVVLAASASGGWQTEMAAETDGGYISLQLDGSGAPHLSHGLTSLCYTYHDGSQWHTETVSYLQQSMYTSLALDGGGNPHISWRSGQTGDQGLIYAFREGTEWELIEITEMGSGNTSLSLGQTDDPHIAFYGLDHFTYTWLEEEAWQMSSFASVTPGAVADMALWDDGTPYIAYIYQNEGLKLATWTGTYWLASIVEMGGYFNAEAISLVLDQNGNPHIAYRCSEDYRYAVHDGSQWQIETIAQGCATPLSSISMQLFETGEPAVAFMATGADNPSIMYAVRNGGSWSAEYVGEGTSPSLALTDDGLARIGYGKGVAGVEFAWQTESGVEPGPGDPLAWLGPNPASCTISVHLAGEGAHGGSLEIRDLSGRLVHARSLLQGESSVELPVSGMPAGLYVCHLRLGEASSARLFAVVR